MKKRAVELVPKLELKSVPKSAVAAAPMNGAVAALAGTAPKKRSPALHASCAIDSLAGCKLVLSQLMECKASEVFMASVDVTAYPKYPR